MQKCISAFGVTEESYYRSGEKPMSEGKIDRWVGREGGGGGAAAELAVKPRLPMVLAKNPPRNVLEDCVSG